MDGFFDGEINPRTAARFLSNPSRLQGVLTQRASGWDATPAEVMADVINVERADVKRLADYHDVDVHIEMMDESRAAELIAGVTQGNGVEVIEVFNDLAQKRDQILKEALDEEEYRAFMRAKTSAMYTDDPETWDDEDYSGGDEEELQQLDAPDRSGDVDDDRGDDQEDLDEPEGSDDVDVQDAIDELDEEESDDQDDEDDVEEGGDDEDN